MAERVERRLAAILAADVAGYGRLIGADEEGTLARLKAHRTELIDPKIVEHKDRAVGVKQIGCDLGVRYVLEGSLRKAGNRIRVTAQLVEAENSKHVWAERYDRNLADVFAIQDEITEAATIAIAPAIAEAELQRALRKPPGSLDAWAAYQRGLWHLGKFAREDNALAKKFFREAIDLDPTFAGGYRGAGYAEFQAAMSGFQKCSLPEAQSSAEALARRAVGLDGADAEARTFLGEMLLYSGDHEGALAEAERALAMTPNLAAAHGWGGAVLIFSGRVNETSVRTGIRLDPCDPLLLLRLNHLAMGLYLPANMRPRLRRLGRASAQTRTSRRPTAGSLRPSGSWVGWRRRRWHSKKLSQSLRFHSTHLFVGAFRGIDQTTTPTCSKVCAKPAGSVDEHCKVAPLDWAIPRTCKVVSADWIL